MIRFFSGQNLPECRKEQTFVGVKIAATFAAYQNKYPFCSVWVQWCGEAPTARILKLEDTVFVEANEMADFDELRNFFAVIGYDSLQSDPDVFLKLGVKPTVLYTVLIRRRELDRLPQVSEPPPLRRVYEILYATESRHIVQSDYSAWYADLSHRIRHQTAAAVLEQDAAVAVASHITTDAAVISGVATEPDHRGRGLAGAALERLIASVNVRNIFAASAPETLPFYLSNHFAECGKVAIFTSVH